jgi:hypothetical protein
MRAFALASVFVTLAISGQPITADARPRAEGVARSADGRIKRSTAPRTQFKKLNPCPATGLSRGACPGYVIDHIHPLKRGGADHPGNMQWQTRAEAKEKDRWE